MAGNFLPQFLVRLHTKGLVRQWQDSAHILALSPAMHDNTLAMLLLVIVRKLKLIHSNCPKELKADRPHPRN